MNLKKVRLSALFIALSVTSSLTVANVVEDTAITAAVKANLILEKDIPATSINVTTNNRVVTLKGETDTNLQANKAIEITASTDNVEDVVDEIKVKDSSSAISDALLTAKVKGKIRHLSLHKKIAEGYDLHVETINNVVHIFGEVINAKDIDTVMDEVRRMKNVSSFKYNIRTKD